MKNLNSTINMGKLLDNLVLFYMLSAVVLVVASLEPLQAATEQNSGEKKIYIVAIDSENVPYEFADIAGRAQGFTPDLLKKIEKGQASS